MTPENPEFLMFVDAAMVVASTTAAWYWYSASRRTVRRITRSENLDAADINRIVVSINRNQILNTRAALASVLAALLAIFRLILDFD